MNYLSSGGHVSRRLVASVTGGNSSIIIGDKRVAALNSTLPLPLQYGEELQTQYLPPGNF